MVARVLSAAMWLAITGCYTPAVRDCAIDCVMTSDCARGQSCTVDGMCASAAIERCGSLGDAARAMDATPITGDAASDARVTLVDAPADAHGAVDLVIAITGMGQVSLTSGQTCSSSGDQHGSCTFAVPYALLQTLRATATHGEHFTTWTAACSGQPNPCTVVPIATTAIGATFGR